MPPYAAIASRLSTRGWITAAGTMVAAIVVLYFLLHLVSAPSYSTLQTGLEPAQTGRMETALSQKGITYQLQNNGTALAVPSNQTSEARVALAAAGVSLENSQEGLSSLKNSSLGESSFQQTVNYQRALQGQIAQTIDQIQGVTGAQVELVLPSTQNQVFGENQEQPSAAVLLPGSSDLEPATVRGIAHLVASSVPNLKTQNVTITGGSGAMLWPNQGSSENGESTSKQAAQEHYDQEMDATLDTMLAQTLGPEAAQAQVYANLNVNQTKQEELSYGKAGVPSSQSKNLETLQGTGAGSGGAAGTAAIPTYTASTSGGKSNYKHEVNTTQYDVAKTIKDSTIAPGEVESEHVSVLLNKSVPASELKAVKEAVTNAAGINPKRGDTLSVAQVKFAKAPATAAAASSSSMIGYAKDALLGIGALIFLFFTTRFLRRRETAEINHEPAWLRELELPMPLAELEREAGASTPAITARANGQTPGARQEVEELAKTSPDVVAQQLRTWMKQG